jgi:hypothetical protein
MTFIVAMRDDSERTMQAEPVAELLCRAKMS